MSGAKRGGEERKGTRRYKSSILCFGIENKFRTQITNLTGLNSLEIGISWAYDSLSVFTSGVIDGTTKEGMRERKAKEAEYIKFTYYIRCNRNISS